ncbi:4Fe-4S dicluster domain-containing protein [Salipaludibacillus sp. CUR1]|uniref:4Fe-4S dicluster domain-containing protein n=1 Tax=Salipaludibacillus sp. CUR1 TaxID=2820003 RepID=UPI00351D7433
MSATQYYFSMDTGKCIRCKACETACNQENSSKGARHRRSFINYEVEKTESVYLSMSCNHCANPVCVVICPRNNYSKKRNGIVVHDAESCEGCKLCVEACPFQAPKYNHETNRVDKCNFCAEKVEGGNLPTCVASCPTQALTFFWTDRSVKLNNDYAAKIPMSYFTKPSIQFRSDKPKMQFFRKA